MVQENKSRGVRRPRRATEGAKDCAASTAATVGFLQAPSDSRAVKLF